LSFLASCTTSKRCAKKFPSIARVDSVYIEKLKEVEIPIPGDSVLIEVLIDCPDQELVVYDSGKLKQQIRILNGKLQSMTNLKPDTVKVTVKEIQTKIMNVRIPVETIHTPKWRIIMSWVGIASTLVLIGLIWLKIR
jgi:hypothetical protein